MLHSLRSSALEVKKSFSFDFNWIILKLSAVFLVRFTFFEVMLGISRLGLHFLGLGFNFLEMCSVF